MSAAAPDFPFGGRLSLDLTWTVRYRAVVPTELLVDADDLRRWLVAAGLPAPARPTAGDLERAHELREAVFRAASAVVDGRSPATTDRRTINRFAAAAPPVPVLDADAGSHLELPAGGGIDAALSAVARDAVELLASAHDGRLRRCEGPQCSLLFRDDSRPGTRRWCDTARCGNRTNTKAYRQRRQGAG